MGLWSPCLVGGDTFQSLSVVITIKSRHLQHTSARQPLSFCTWSSEPHRRFAPRVHEAAATRTSYVTVHTCTMRVEKVCKVREEPAPRLAAERDALGSHCLECLAASASRDFWGFPEAQCTTISEHSWWLVGGHAARWLTGLCGEGKAVVESGSRAFVGGGRLASCERKRGSGQKALVK